MQPILHRYLFQVHHSPKSGLRQIPSPLRSLSIVAVAACRSFSKGLAAPTHQPRHGPAHRRPRLARAHVHAVKQTHVHFRSSYRVVTTLVAVNSIPLSLLDLCHRRCPICSVLGFCLELLYLVDRICSVQNSCLVCLSVHRPVLAPATPQDSVDLQQVTRILVTQLPLEVVQTHEGSM